MTTAAALPTAGVGGAEATESTPPPRALSVAPPPRLLTPNRRAAAAKGLGVLFDDVAARLRRTGQPVPDCLT